MVGKCAKNILILRFMYPETSNIYRSANFVRNT
jgi:hypothetical protein